MNTNGLARHYGCLTPRERLPLIMAAAARGDEVERERVVNSAPDRMFRVPDYYGLAEAFRELADFHRMRQLEAAGWYWLALGMVPDRPRGRKDPEGEKREAQLDRASQLFAHQFVARAEAWERLCHEYGLDPEEGLRIMPGYELMNLAGKSLKLLAPTLEEAVALSAGEGREPARLISAEDVLADYRAAVEMVTDWWS